MTPSKEEVRAAYIDEIGYDPFEDDPSVTVDDAWTVLLDFRAYHLVDLEDPNAVWSRHHY